MSETSPSSLQDLYAAAFTRFGTACLWSKKPVAFPTVEHARIIAQSLRVEGGRDAYRLAREIEAICDAADVAAA